MRPVLVPEEVDVGLQFAGLVLTLQGQLVEELHTTFLGLFEVFAPDDGKREVRVEFRGDFVRLVRGHVRVHLEPGMARPAEGVDTADPRREAVVGIFGDEAVFDAHAFKGDVFLRIADGGSPRPMRICSAMMSTSPCPLTLEMRAETPFST